MQRVEAQVVSAFQINYFTLKARHGTLTDDELLLLKAALRCHETVEKLESRDLSLIHSPLN